MIIGVPKEVKDSENRVAISPAGVDALIGAGHRVLIEKGAGEGSGFPDQALSKHGAKIVETAEEVWSTSEMILKVKEPQASEYQYFRKGLCLFTYLHLAPEPELTRALMENEVTAIAYETIQLDNGRFATSYTNVRSGRTYVGSNRGAVSGKTKWRKRGFVGRSARGSSGGSRDYWRRGGWNKCGKNGFGFRSQCDHSRSKSRSSASVG